MPENTQESIYLKFIDLGFEVAKLIPRYFSKFSNKIFCNHEHIVLLVLRQKLKMPYREFIEFLKASTIPLHLCLKIMFENIICKFICIFYIRFNFRVFIVLQS